MRAHLVWLVSLTVAGCAARHPRASIQESHPWPTVQGSVYTFADGCAIEFSRAAEGCHVLRPKSGSCGSTHGVYVEKTWIASQYPNSRLLGQDLSSTVEAHPRMLDSITIQTLGGEEVSMCFDITELW